MQKVWPGQAVSHTSQKCAGSQANASSIPFPAGSAHFCEVWLTAQLLTYTFTPDGLGIHALSGRFPSPRKNPKKFSDST